MVRTAVWVPFSVPVIVTVWVVATAIVLTVNVAEVAPAATFTEAGTVAFALFDDSVTTSPAAPASPLKVTVPVDETPPRTDVGLTVTLTRVASVTVSVAVWVTPLSKPEIVAVFVVETGTVVIVKVAVVAPTSTVTEGGAVAQLMLDDSDTTVPPIGAGPLIVTVPVEETPPWTEVGLTLTLTKVGAVTAKVPVWVTLLSVPEIVAVTLLDTGVVLTVKVAEEEPAGTVTDAPTVALPLLEDSVTTEPPGPARPLRVTVPVEDVPPMTEVGLSVTLTSVAGVTVRVAVLVTLPSIPLMVAILVFVTGAVVMPKVAEVAPTGTVTDAGTVAQLMLHDNVTTVPLVDAGPLMVTVPVDDVPPTTDVGATPTLTKVGLPPPLSPEISQRLPVV
jgi:hypothetical protein